MVIRKTKEQKLDIEPGPGKVCNAWWQSFEEKHSKSSFYKITTENTVQLYSKVRL